MRSQPAFDDSTIDTVIHAGGQRFKRIGQIAQPDPDQQVGCGDNVLMRAARVKFTDAAERLVGAGRGRMHIAKEADEDRRGIRKRQQPSGGFDGPVELTEATVGQ